VDVVHGHHRPCLGEVGVHEAAFVARPMLLFAREKRRPRRQECCRVPCKGCPPTSSSNRAIINPSKCRPHPAKSLNRGHLSWTTESLPKSRRCFPHLFELAPSLPPSQILCAHPSNLFRRMSDATIVCKSAKICRSFRRAAGSDAIWERLVRRRWTCKLK